jgi:hypothetical protein
MAPKLKLFRFDSMRSRLPVTILRVGLRVVQFRFLHCVDLLVLRRFLPVVFLLLGIANAEAQESPDEQVKQWIADLGSPMFNTRQAASKNLAARGAKAIGALTQICEASEDRETVTRAVQVLGQILETRDDATSQEAEAALRNLVDHAEKSVALLAKSTLSHWKMKICIRTIDRLKRQGAWIGQPTTTADGTPEVTLQLSLKDWKGKDSDLALLPDLGRIFVFQVAQAPMGNEGLKFLTKCQSVERIFLDQTQIDARGLEIIAHVPRLKNLRLMGLKTLDRQGVESLSAISTLESLNLDSSRLTSDMLPAIARLKGLRSLDLSRTGVSDERITVLAELPNLNNLNLSGANIDGEGIASLAKAPALDTLNLRGSQLGPAALDGIGKLERVRYLILDQIDLSSADFSKLEGMKGLRTLDLVSCQITDNNARSLGRLTQVSRIVLQGNPGISSTVRDQISEQIPKTQITR